VKKDFKIGIIGTGYVGTAIKLFFEKLISVETFDIIKECSTSSIEELVSKSNIIFLCLPTPMNKDGSTNFDIINDVLDEINSFYSAKSEKTFVIKSTIPVGTTKDFIDKFNRLELVFNPEFLREASFVEDFSNQNRIILGYNKRNDLIFNLYKEYFPNTEIIEVDSSTAEMVKYLVNCFLATKVSFANEMKLFCDAKKINYNDIIKIAIKDVRLGESHWQVPGPDGKNGFGGSCFPKDIVSLIEQFKIANVNSYVIKAAWQRNFDIDRPDHDWLKLKNRAVV
tara:strand:+ start:165 stop:1010 length:846 start_codon:yes stop_codon:yes gene_type:complete